MSGKTLAQMNCAELRRECAFRQLPCYATKPNMLVMLEENIRSEGRDPATEILPPRTPLDSENSVREPEVVVVDNSTDRTREFDANYQRPGVAPLPEEHPVNLALHTSDDESDVDQPGDITRASGQLGVPYVEDVYVARSIAHAAEQVGAIRQNIRDISNNARIEARMTELERSLSRMSLEQRQISNMLERLSQNMLPSPHVDAQPTIRQVNVERNDSRRSDAHRVTFGPSGATDPTRHDATLHERLADIEAQEARNMRRSYGQASRASLPRMCSTGWQDEHIPRSHTYENEPTDFSFTRQPREGQSNTTDGRRSFNDLSPTRSSRSVLVPYHDLRTVRACLPEYYGRNEEDPREFLDRAEDLLCQGGIHPTAWVNIVVPFLNDRAGDWWRAIKLNNMPWAEFRSELLEEFDNIDIRTALETDLKTTRQGPRQTLTEFIIHKQRLAARVRCGLPEQQLVRQLTGLLRDDYRAMIRLMHPASFADLREIAHDVDKTAAPRYAPPASRQPADLHPRHTAQPAARQRAGYAHADAPPTPCRYCGERHWHRQCPNRPSVSGNGNRLGGN
ncbi:uncharacterized protein LOC126894907 isoform X1 [Daktulosphaira vitifoliae]|uniref:uncharacterized protein LOC126894907 isoform X1 n=1 Tax=Daktulosphaira vitifoliae TaxID=58002 RepID=UPI0021AA4B35|nr:uncharacterized protein LOC126894907 isoform X1 [Daktulosphaira vitifoliae]XP_050522204.1 uncharacterized protein LOC126894907 isoform X1 [Daktulosphaira vitifoliae]